MRKENKLFAIVLTVLVVVVASLIIIFSRPVYVEGEIIEKYIDTGDQDAFQFVLMEDDGSYILVVVDLEQYYGYEVGDWFEGEVISKDDPDSWWS